MRSAASRTVACALIVLNRREIQVALREMTRPSVQLVVPAADINDLLVADPPETIGVL
jgi:hypothetical protein